jgi:hypothetical protein
MNKLHDNNRDRISYERLNKERLFEYRNIALQQRRLIREVIFNHTHSVGWSNSGNEWNIGNPTQRPMGGEFVKLIIEILAFEHHLAVIAAGIGTRLIVAQRSFCFHRARCCLIQQGDAPNVVTAEVHIHRKRTRCDENEQR